MKAEWTKRGEECRMRGLMDRCVPGKVSAAQHYVPANVTGTMMGREGQQRAVQYVLSFKITQPFAGSARHFPNTTASHFFFLRKAFRVTCFCCQSEAFHFTDNSFACILIFKKKTIIFTYSKSLYSQCK